VKVDVACSVGVHMAHGRTWDVALFRSRVSSCGEAESRRAHDERYERNANDQTANRCRL